MCWGQSVLHTGFHLPVGLVCICYLLLALGKQRNPERKKKKWQIIEAAFCFLPEHLSCFQLLGFSFALKFDCDGELPMGCSVLCAIFKAFLTSVR